MKTALMFFSTARSLRYRVRAMAWLLLPAAISRSTSSSRGASSASGPRVRRAARDQRLDDLGVDHRTARGDGPQCLDDLLQVGDPFLQQVPQPAGALLEQVDGVGVLGVLGQDDDPDARVLGTDPAGGVDPLRGPRRRHPDVGEHDVGAVLADRGEQLVEIRGEGRDLELGRPREQGRRALAHEVVVLREHQAQDHARTLGAPQLRPSGE